MDSFDEFGSPAGRIYQHGPSLDIWTIELEIGGVVWLVSDNNEIRQLGLPDLETPEWRRIH